LYVIFTIYIFISHFVEFYPNIYIDMYSIKKFYVYKVIKQKQKTCYIFTIIKIGNKTIPKQ